MYIYLVFVLIGILLFLLFNNKNKFSIGVPDHGVPDDSSESGVPGITAADLTAAVSTVPQYDPSTAQQIWQLHKTGPGQVSPTPGLGVESYFEVAVEEEAISAGTIATVCAAAIAAFATIGYAIRNRNTGTDTNTNEERTDLIDTVPDADTDTDFDIETPGP